MSISINKRLIQFFLMLAIGLSGFGGRRADAAEYMIQPEDVLSVRVSGEAGLSQNYTVDEKGEIQLDQVGKVRLAGLSVKDAKEKLNTELSKYLKLFELSVSVVGETGSRVLVYGAVGKPGTYKVRQGAKLLDVLAEAGQPTPAADTKRVSVGRKDGGKTETVDLDAVFKDPKLNLPIEAGDTITIPSRETRSVRVDGEVKNLIQIPLEIAPTASSAILAAGPTERSDWSRIALRRKDSSVPVILDLSRVRTGQLKDDFPLQEGDRLTVMSRFAGVVKVSGEVKNPGEKELNGSTKLWDLIMTQAGGFNEKADQMRVQILRGGKSAETFDLLAVSKGIRRSDDPKMVVEPGDEVFIPTGTVKVRGEVKTPGEWPLRSITNVWDFVTMAGGGFTDNADRSRVQITREGKPLRTVDLTAVADGKKSYDTPEFEILPGDEVSIPNDEPNRFAIVGGVKKPGRFTAKPGMRLYDAITLAESFTERASRKKLVIARADQFGPDGMLKAAPQDKTKKAKAKDDPEALGLVVIDIKKLMSGDLTQNVAINPGDRILVPEEALKGPGKPSFLQSIMQMVPLAGMFMGVGGGFGGFGGGGFR